MMGNVLRRLALRIVGDEMSGVSAGVSHFGHEVAGGLGNRGVGVIVDLGTGDDRHPFVEQVGERADHAGLGLPTLAQEDHVVTSENGILELRKNGVLVAQNAVEERFAGDDSHDGVLTKFFLDRAADPARGTQFSESGWPL